MKVTLILGTSWRCHICQGLAGAVCFWAATLKAARGTKVSFPCYETWINKSQPFHTSDLLQVADWRLCRICPKDFMWNWTLRVDHIFCPTKVWQNMLPVPHKKVWMKRGQMHRNDITLGLQSRSWFALSFGFSFQPHMVTFLHLHDLHLASVFAVKHKAVHKSLAKLNSMSPSAHCKYVLNVPTCLMFAHQTLTCFSQSTGDARQMSPRCLGLMLKINAWWSGAIWSPKKLFLGFSIWGYPRLLKVKGCFFRGWKSFLGFWLLGFCLHRWVVRSHDSRISAVKAESQEGTWRMDDPQSQRKDDLSFDYWGTMYRNLPKRRWFSFFSWHVVSYMFVIPEWDKPGVSCTPSLIRNEPSLPRNKSATFWSNWIQWSKEWFMQS